MNYMGNKYLFVLLSAFYTNLVLWYGLMFVDALVR